MAAYCWLLGFPVCKGLLVASGNFPTKIWNSHHNYLQKAYLVAYCVHTKLPTKHMHLLLHTPHHLLIYFLKDTWNTTTMEVSIAQIPTNLRPAQNIVKWTCLKYSLANNPQTHTQTNWDLSCGTLFHPTGSSCGFVIFLEKWSWSQCSLHITTIHAKHRLLNTDDY